MGLPSTPKDGASIACHRAPLSNVIIVLFSCERLVETNWLAISVPFILSIYSKNRTPLHILTHQVSKYHMEIFEEGNIFKKCKKYFFIHKSPETINGDTY